MPRQKQVYNLPYLSKKQITLLARQLYATYICCQGLVLGYFDKKSRVKNTKFKPKK